MGPELLNIDGEDASTLSTLCDMPQPAESVLHSENYLERTTQRPFPSENSLEEEVYQLEDRDHNGSPIVPPISPVSEICDDSEDEIVQVAVEDHENASLSTTPEQEKWSIQLARQLMEFQWCCADCHAQGRILGGETEQRQQQRSIGLSDLIQWDVPDVLAIPRLAD
jgi:hypothetical protein